jgi:hypothetical protein
LEYKVTMDAMASTTLSSLTLYDPFNLTSIAAQIIMYPLSSLLLAGSLAIQAVLSLPDPSRVKERDAEILKRSVDSFLATESPIALTVSALPSLKHPIISCTFENTVHSMQLQVLITST